MYTSEIYFNSSYISKEEWNTFIKDLTNYNGYIFPWKIIIKIENNKINYYIKTKFKPSTNISSNSSFILKKCEEISIQEQYITFPIHMPLEKNIIDYINYCRIKKLGELKYITIKFHKIKEDKIISTIHLYIENQNKLIKYRLIFNIPSTILSIDFKKNNRYIYKKIPKYFDISKIFHLLKTDSVNSFLEIDTFPYLDGNFYLNNQYIDINRHSLIIGSSGSGKSKMISSLIKNIYDTFKSKYKIVIIDPHASLKNDIGKISKIIDFKNIEDSINLFSSSTKDIIATTELTLDLFKTLINDQYNSKLERVLRHSIYLLLIYNEFNFNNLKLLITDPYFRTQIINKVKGNLPESVIHFFLNDFNDLKTKSYSEAISPIISFIDEMFMIPVLNSKNIPNTLEQTINDNFITLFSLDKTILGNKVTKTISGFIMQQLLLLIQSKKINEHIIFIIDEVPIVENNILSSFLSEARKYNLSLILASQYFNQISQNLKDSIFANVINYYIFRVSRTDAQLLSNHLDIKIPNISDKTIEEQQEEKINILSNLNNRECIVRISSNNILTSSFKAKTLDFIPMPSKEKEIVKQELNKEEVSKKIQFNINNINLKDILKQTSSSRMVVK